MPVTIVNPVPAWQRSLMILSGTVVGFLVIVALEWARPVLIPIALAILLTFLLNPLVKTLHRRGLSQVLSVMTAVSLAGVILMCLGWFVSKQVTGMLAELPRNTARIKAKVKSLRELATGPTKERIGQMIEEISQEITRPLDGIQKSNAAQTQDESQNDGTVDPHTGMVVINKEPIAWTRLTGVVGSAFEILATLALSLVLLVFFLIEREDLRDRIVLLAGGAKLALTSKALEDITDRISRYLCMVALVNGGFGLILTCGLLVLHVPYALLWGFIAATLRFLPYIGPWIGAVFPITMSLALSDGWGQPIAVFAFVAVVELVTNNFVEPLLFGHTIGVSPTALLVSAASWLYLWGPIGLVLSAPFAVCLVVLGKNIPQLSFLYLLMGDKPAFNTDYSFYQRLMLGDFQEATGLALKRVKDASPVSAFDELLIPALHFARRDVERNYLSEDDQRQVIQGMRYTLDKTAEELAQADKIPDHSSQLVKVGADDDATPSVLSSARPVTILGCPATDETDQVVLEMLKQLLDPNHWNLEVTALETLTSELLIRIHEDPPSIVFIASVPPGGLAHCRYLCKRLRTASPQLQIVVQRSGQKRYEKRDQERLERAGANFVTITLQESLKLLNARLPLLASPPSDVSSAEPRDAGSGVRIGAALRC